MASQFDKQGHRGCRGLMPENTIPAMLHAIDLNVNTLEMDVVFTSDMKAVLSHEPFFNHDITTKPDGGRIAESEQRTYNIYKMTYDEVKKYDVGIKPHPKYERQQKLNAIKPLLSDVIDSVEQYAKAHNKSPLYYNIETKTTPASDNLFHPTPDIFVDELMKVISGKNIKDRVTIQSFDIRTLQHLHKKYPDVSTSLLIEPDERLTVQKKIENLGFKPNVISPEFHMVDDGLIDYAHSNGMKILPWTVNDAAIIGKLREHGVDGIITDYPDLFGK